ncbi:MAG TPA: DUF2059 domain-containing protein [Blastocatellia bacterium]|jgi:hypothetical protein|nr:DUF2059 domain-containing protein [Blastocatellia bacterium]
MKSAMKLAGLVLLLVGSLCSSASAQQEIKPEKRALIKELYLATKADKMAESFTNIILTQMERDLPKTLSELPEMTDLKKKDRDQAQRVMFETSGRLLARFKELIPQRINFAEVMEQMFYPLYDKFFTEDELKDLVAFYKSPTGQKSIGVMPQLLQDAMQRSSEALNAKVTQLVNEVLEQERKHLKGTGTAKN